MLYAMRRGNRQIVTIQERGVIALPADLRRRYNLKPGDQLAIGEAEDGRLELISLVANESRSTVRDPRRERTSTTGTRGRFALEGLTGVCLQMTRRSLSKNQRIMSSPAVSAIAAIKKSIAGRR